VHRDVKPQNLMRFGETAVKVMDFGLAKDPSTQLTHDGSLSGTPNYMAPEQVRGETLDGRSDLFSLGVVLYEMVCGEKPFGGESISSVLYRIVNEEPKRILAVRPGIPQALATFLDKALAKDPGERFASGEAFAGALRQAVRGAAATAARPSASRRLRRTRGRRPAAGARRALPWVAALGVLAVLVATAFVVLPSRFGSKEGGAGEGGAWLEASVRTEPPGLPVTLDGKPLEGPRVRFRRSGPFGILAAEQDCRKATHPLELADAGTDVVLVIDPLEVEVVVDPGVREARVGLNGSDPGAAPARLSLSLCRENVLEASAEGYGTARVSIPAGSTPVAARTLAEGIRLDPLPTGTLRLPRTRLPVSFLVDGRKVRAASGGSS